MSMWNCAHGVSITTTALQLGLNEKTATKHYRRAMEVMCCDVIQKQSEVVFGELEGGLTADCEADEHSFAYWNDGDTHFWYPWVGVVEVMDATRRHHKIGGRGARSTSLR